MILNLTYSCLSSWMTLKLGCHSKSPSLLKVLPESAIESIYEFATLPKPRLRPSLAAATSSSAAVAAAAKHRSSSGTCQGHTVNRVGYAESDDGKENMPVKKKQSIELKDFRIYNPSKKIVIPLATPDKHLTGPCQRGRRSCSAFLFFAVSHSCSIGLFNRVQ